MQKEIYNPLILISRGRKLSYSGIKQISVCVVPVKKGRKNYQKTEDVFRH